MIISSIAKRVPLVVYVIILMGGIFAVQQLRISRADRRATASAFRADSVEAINSTTQQVGHAYLRRAVQAEVARDSLDKKLKTETKVRIDLELELASGEDADTVMINEDDEWAQFHGKVAPANVQVDIVWPAKGGDARAHFGVTFDPIRLNVQVKCSIKDSDGVRQAMTLVRPELAGISAQIVNTTQDRGVCSAKQAAHKSRTKAALIVGGVAGLAAGFFLFR